MGSSQTLVVAILALALAIYLGHVEANYYEDTHFTWGANHCSISNEGNDLQLVLDRNSGSGIKTNKAYLFGSIEMQIKLVPNNSAGTVTAYYLSSTGDGHDEIDFEFLGNVSKQPYIIHTNIFVQGIGNREQQFHPWFDPTTDFHNYTIHWNPTEVVWYIDSVPIRVYRNYESEGIPYPNRQGMKLYSSLWNADDWATQGGRKKIDWNCAPFLAKYRQFKARACQWEGPFSVYRCSAPTPANWWTSSTYKQLSYSKQGQMKWIRDHYMIYDYCKDTERFQGKLPSECCKPQY